MECWYSDGGKVISDGWKWLRDLKAALAFRSIDRNCGLHAAERMRKVGSVQVQVEKFPTASGCERGENRVLIGESRLAYYGQRVRKVISVIQSPKKLLLGL